MTADEFKKLKITAKDLVCISKFTLKGLVKYVGSMHSYKQYDIETSELMYTISTTSSHRAGSPSKIANIKSIEILKKDFWDA